VYEKLPELSVDGSQASDTLDVVLPVTRRFEGAVGGVRSRDPADAIREPRIGNTASGGVEITKPAGMAANSSSAVSENRRTLRVSLFCALRTVQLVPIVLSIAQVSLFTERGTLRGGSLLTFITSGEDFAQLTQNLLKN
jgi:hypothetical protein